MPAFFRNSQELIRSFFEILSSRVVLFSAPAMAGLTLPSEIVQIIRGFRSWGQKTMPLIF